MTTMPDVEPSWVERLLDMQRRTRDALRRAMDGQVDDSKLVARDEDATGDTIFSIDIDAEDVLVECCESWARDHSFVIVAEGLDPAGVKFGSGPPSVRIIIDPIDGTRGLMYDKRSAWALAAVAPDRGTATRLSDVQAAVMCELPTTRQYLAEELTAIRGAGVTVRRRANLLDGRITSDLRAQPSRATNLLHGFSTICNFFQGGKEITSRIEEAFFNRALDGGWNVGKAEVYTDQYISSGGQLAEVVLGRDRCVIDIRPLVHRALGHPQTLCSRPYDVCTALIATEAGCVVTTPFGEPLDAPLDTTTNVAFAAFANRSLADRLLPILGDVLKAELG